MKTAAKSGRHAGIAIAAGALLAVIGVVLISYAHGIEATTAPTTQPAGAPAGAPDTRADTPDNISVAAITLTDREKTALGAVRDGNGTYEESAFFMMLARAGKFAADQNAAAAEFGSLESPAVGNITDYPSRYRAQKIRLMMRVQTSRKHVSGDDTWTPRADWPRGKPVWYLGGYHVADKTTGKKRKAEDLVVYSVVDPSALLGEPSGTLKGDLTYDGRGRQLELSGIYYKVFTKTADASKKTRSVKREYPLVIAYHLRPVSGADASPPMSAMGGIFIAAMILLVAILYAVRSKARRARVQPMGEGLTGGARYTPLRDIDLDDLPPGQQTDEPVDQALVDAVRKFESKRRGSDGTDHKS